MSLYFFFFSISRIFCFSLFLFFLYVFCKNSFCCP
uniref:Uncharacterized protein n=1 Tax=Rhizophora mucronata TaxID=61149 RepID=A0A2P2PFB9_RHIMU